LGYKYINNRRAKCSLKNVNILSNLSEKEMIHYMTIAKVVLIPSSVLSFEAMAIRKPIFTCYFVDNQKLIHQGLNQLNLAKTIGYVESLNDVKIATMSFLKFYQDDLLQQKKVEVQHRFLDGHSSERLRTIIIKRK
jgi:spore coat polysaccharide biosynthesis predicted glycosyltransferase SpsG